MISQAIALSLVTFAGFFILFSKLPQSVKDFINRHDLATDIACLGAAYLLLGGTLTALFAAALVGLFVSVALYVGHNKEDFLYLWDVEEVIKEKMAQIKEAMLQYGRDYRAKKEIIAEAIDA